MGELTRGPKLPDGQEYPEGCPNCGGPTDREHDYCLACQDSSIVINRLKAAWVPCEVEPDNTGVTIARDWAVLQLAIKVIDLPLASPKEWGPEMLAGTGRIGLFLTTDGELEIDS